jgi:sugar lactone lactonase YvrE
MTWRASLVFEAPGERLEGLAWDGEALLVCNVSRDEIVRVDPSNGASECFRAHSVRTSALAFAPDGRLFGIQGSRRVVHFDEDGSTYITNVMLDGLRHNQPRSLVIDEFSRIWFSDPLVPGIPTGPAHLPPLDHGSVLRLDRSTSAERETFGEWLLRRATYDTAEPGALALSADETRLYVMEERASTGHGELRAYPIGGSGELGAFEVLHVFGSDYRGSQHGIAAMCTDRDGKIVAVGGEDGRAPGALVYVFAPSGRVVRSEPVAHGRPTSCVFGGPALDVLFVATASGAVLRVDGTELQGAEGPSYARRRSS